MNDISLLFPLAQSSVAGDAFGASNGEQGTFEGLLSDLQGQVAGQGGDHPSELVERESSGLTEESADDQAVAVAVFAAIAVPANISPRNLNPTGQETLQPIANLPGAVLRVDGSGEPAAAASSAQRNSPKADEAGTEPVGELPADQAPGVTPADPAIDDVAAKHEQGLILADDPAAEADFAGRPASLASSSARYLEVDRPTLSRVEPDNLVEPEPFHRSVASGLGPAITAGFETDLAFDSLGVSDLTETAETEPFIVSKSLPLGSQPSANLSAAQAYQNAAPSKPAGWSSSDPVRHDQADAVGGSAVERPALNASDGSLRPVRLTASANQTEPQAQAMLLKAHRETASLTADPSIDPLALAMTEVVSGGGLDVGAVRSGERGQQPALPVADQILVAVHQARDRGQNRVTVNLHPAELGAVEISIEMAADGHLHAHIAVERQETLEIIQKDNGLLGQRFADTGIDLAGGTLEFSLKDQSNGERDKHPPADRGTAAGGDDDLGEDGKPAAVRRHAVGLIDVSV